MSWFSKKIEVLPAAKGRVIGLEEVPDPAFSQKMLGDGFAVEPSEGIITAPMDGKLVSIFPTMHAFNLENDYAEILVHIGIDTVSLKGEGFEKLASEGTNVKAGDPIIKVDLDLLKEKGLSSITPIIVAPKSGKELKIDLSKSKIEIN